MSHSVTIILGALDELIADGTEGPLVELRGAAGAGDAYLEEGEHGNDGEVHEQLENLQTWLTNNYIQSGGVCATANAFTTAINTLIAK